MSNDYFYNPLGHDEQIIAEKLGMYEYTNKPENDVNTNLQVALLKEELENSKRRVAQLQTAINPPKREHFVAGGGCGCQAKRAVRPEPVAPEAAEPIVFDKKLLIFLVIIMAVFCVLQYYSYKNETRELMEMLCMLASQQAKQSGAGQPVQSSPVPAMQPSPVPAMQPVAVSAMQPNPIQSVPSA